MPKNLKPVPLVELDPWLAPYERNLTQRIQRYRAMRKRLLPAGGTLQDFANGAYHYGIHRTQEGWVYREWAPHAQALYFFGEFNNWNRGAHPMTRLENGDWELTLPASALAHGQKVLVHVVHDGAGEDRIPLYIRRVAQDPETRRFAGQVWAPETPFAWTDARRRKAPPKPLLIYEAHIGMAQEGERVGSYDEFAKDVLPRIVRAGYNAVQLMAVMEHPYYASFGYQVANFFAASSWYGEPEGLKRLINEAHRLGLTVLLDLVHAHAAPNRAEGIAGFDGTDTQFFHAGARGIHPAWGTRLFDYGQPGVLHFLLSNIKFWLEEYHFDGLRFDGVTSMLYWDHGLGRGFNGYDAYFSPNTDLDAAAYLMLANELAHGLRRNAVTVAEDVSGMPGLCRPVREGGFGFDYRLAMGVPDFWIETLDKPDEALDIPRLWHELTQRRPCEATIGYSESHDQALVGDKTLIFRLADSAMYTLMNKGSQSLVIDRAMALLKLIRLITLTLAGEGYLNFMGNEFGHPEWVDFPREGNQWSYQYARRQWSLGDNGLLRYSQVGAFDRDMLALAKDRGILQARDTLNLWMDQERKLLAYRKAGLVFLFNFHPVLSQTDVYLPVREAGRWQVCFSTDAIAYGGGERIDANYVYQTREDPALGVGFSIYSPCRTALVLRRLGEGE